jgi:serine/threonine protein kinase
MFARFLPKCCIPNKHLNLETVLPVVDDNIQQIHTCIPSSNETEIHDISIDTIIELIKNNEYIHKFKCIKSYKLNILGVFHYKQFIIRIDSTEYDVCRNEQNVMSLLGTYTYISNKINIVLPRIVQRINEQMIISIQPFIDNSMTLDKWVENNYNICRNHKLIIPIFIKLCKLLEHLHSHTIVHGDIKPTNILIQSPLNEPYLIDFGMTGIANKSPGTGGTNVFCHPATGNNKAHNDDEYTWCANRIENDIWSIGFIFLTIILYKKCLQTIESIPPPLLLIDGYIDFSYIKMNGVITNMKLIEIFEYILHKTPSWRNMTDIIEQLEAHVKKL